MRKKKSNLGWGCLALLVVGVFIFRLFFTATADGTISSVRRVGKTRDELQVRYTYKVDDKRYEGTERLSFRYNPTSGDKVKVRRWRFLHSVSSLKKLSLKVRRGHTFKDQFITFVLEWSFAAVVAFVAVLLGIAPKKKK